MMPTIWFVLLTTLWMCRSKDNQNWLKSFSLSQAFNLNFLFNFLKFSFKYAHMFDCLFTTTSTAFILFPKCFVINASLPDSSTIFPFSSFPLLPLMHSYKSFSLIKDSTPSSINIQGLAQGSKHFTSILDKAGW